VLYGSNSGTCEAFAAQVVDAAAAAGFAAAAATLDSRMSAAGKAELPVKGAVLIITST
jgi:cytochrome P450/NADPH-cytochrome P450 reductase